MPQPAEPLTQYAITVLGHDRPGIIAQTAEILADAGMNLTDSSMTLLRGHFAMTLICTGEATAGQLTAALAAALDASLTVRVLELPDNGAATERGQSVLVTVHGADRLGIVAKIADVIAQAGGNITDLTTRLAGGLYVLAAEVDLPAGVSDTDLATRVREAGHSVGVEASVRPLDRDDL